MTKRYTEETLVLRLRDGSTDAFEQLYGHYHQALLKTIIHIVKDPLEAEDLLQDTYLKIWLRFHGYDTGQGTLFTWLVNIARNTALDALRRRKNGCLALNYEAEIVPATANWWSATDTIGVEYTVRRALTPHQWQIIELVYWRGYTRQEIAEELALPLGTVKTRIYQSLRQLRPIFQ